ncbi:hypothetical protein CVV38_04205 [Candidatus Peregrinibacteria bacterium HGW-Peregrinibacteria-1]|jgi:hypothetical protein|nr:MAG: hypothetical protein CVV38_04205 [Candidatus Peregrinibacteria bacterium HGW-Peregrinibacteria-1]
MKKFLCTIITTLILLSNLSLLTYAAESDSPPAGEDTIIGNKEDQAKAAFPFADVTDTPCITPEQQKSYIYTISEEPLIPYPEEAQEGTTVDFQRFTCYRNTYSVPKDGGGRITYTFLGRSCSQGAIQAAQANPQFSFSCQEVGIMLSKGGTSLIEGYIATIFQWAGTIVVVLSVLVITISGIQVSAAGSDTQAIDSAKSRIVKSIGGIAILFLAWIILKTVNPNFFT